MAHTLYKIYYDFGLAYIGRTNQPLQRRLHGHFFKKRLHREIDIGAVTLIQRVELPTEADMLLYELYLINALKPPLNSANKTNDELTVELPLLEFKDYYCRLLGKWKAQIVENDKIERKKELNEIEFFEKKQDLKRERRSGAITEDEYFDKLEELEQELGNGFMQ